MNINYTNDQYFQDSNVSPQPQKWDECVLLHFDDRFILRIKDDFEMLDLIAQMIDIYNLMNPTNTYTMYKTNRGCQKCGGLELGDPYDEEF
jgi:hypothetical protein